MSIKMPSSKSKFRIAVSLIAVLLVALLVSWLFLNNQHSPSEPRVRETPKPMPLPVSVSTDMLLTGNSFWGRYTNDHAMKTEEPYKFPFSRLSEFEREKYDAWITGLECPTSQKGVGMSSADMEATLTFNCDPAYLPEFAKWFTAVSLANNHTDNMGADGFADTQEALAKNKIQYFGHYNPEQLNDICDVVSIPARVKYDDGTEKKQSIPIALCGYHFVFQLPSEESVATIKKYAEYFPTIVMPHGGAEYKAAPDQIKTDLYRSMIDAGADMVIGDHPHWVQTTEAYKDKLIVYSMGNFMFDQQGSAELVRSATIEVKAEFAVNDDITRRWIGLGKSCDAYHDNCLETAEKDKLSRPTLNYKFGVVASDDKGYVTHRADATVQAAVEQRLRWAETMKELGQ